MPPPLLSFYRVQFDSAELAMAVAAEWDAQDTTKGIEPAVMPLMSLASTAIDQVSQPVRHHVTRGVRDRCFASHATYSRSGGIFF